MRKFVLFLIIFNPISIGLIEYIGYKLGRIFPNTILENDRFIIAINFIYLTLWLWLIIGIIVITEYKAEQKQRKDKAKKEAEIEAYDKFLKFLKDLQNKHNITTNLNCIISFNDTQIHCPKIEDYKLLFQQKGDITFSMHLYNRFHSRYGICKKNKITKRISLKDIICNSSFEFIFEQTFIKEQLEKWESESDAIGTQIIKDSIDSSNSNLICLKPNCIYKNQKYCCERKLEKNKKFSQNIIYEILKENWEYEKTLIHYD